MLRLRRKPLILLLVKRAVFFITVLCALSVFLYGVGTAQNFLESTQLGLLRFTAWSGLLLAVASGYGVVLDVSYFFVSRVRSFLFGALFYLFSASFGVAAAAAANGILVIVSGNLT